MAAPHGMISVSDESRQLLGKRMSIPEAVDRGSLALAFGVDVVVAECVSIPEQPNREIYYIIP